MPENLGNLLVLGHNSCDKDYVTLTAERQKFSVFTFPPESSVGPEQSRDEKKLTLKYCICAYTPHLAQDKTL